MRPVRPVVREITVIPDLRALHQRVQPLLTGLLSGPAAEIQVLMTGLPVASLQWADSLIELRVHDVVESALPGFTAPIRIHPAEAAPLHLTTVPLDSRFLRHTGV